MMTITTILLLLLFIQVSVVCSQRTETFDHYNLRFYDTKKTFNDAKAQCECNDGWIAEPRYLEIESIITSFTNHVVWIGLSLEEDWRWGDGKEVTYTNWKTSVSNSSHEKCVTISRNAGWTVTACDETIRFVCQYDKDFRGNKQLLFGTPAVRYNAAKSACEKDGWERLVDVKSKAVNDFIKAGMSAGTQFFTSASDALSEGNWKWRDGCSVDYEDWISPEPNGGRRENCMAITKTGWIDVPCDSIIERRYICQKDKPYGSCTSALCLNKGNCTRKGKIYLCKCNLGRYGSKCEKDRCQPPPCLNQGNCSYTSTYPYHKCVCKPEFTGADCSNYTYVEKDGCKYHVHWREFPVLFSEAKKLCKGLGGTLAMIKNSKIQNVIQQQLVKQYGLKGQKYFWFGGEKKYGTWYWEDGTLMPAVKSSGRWKDREVAQLSSWWSGLLNDTDWTTQFRNKTLRGYVCEKPVADPCIKNPCLNNGSCVSTGCYFNCSCVYPYYGDNCRNVHIRLTNSSIYSHGYSRVNVSCVFTGYPNAIIHWKWRLGASRQNISHQNNTIFDLYQSYENESTIGILEVKQRDFLGTAEIGCFAVNPYETTNITYDTPNADLIIARGMSYEIVNNKVNASDAKSICTSRGRQVLQILDNFTQNLISSKLSDYGVGHDVYIDLKKNGSNGTFLWILSNGTTVYNVTVGDDNSTYILNEGTFAKWGQFEPSSTGECVVLQQANDWLWATVNCSERATVICQKPVDGTIDELRVATEQCRPKVSLSLSPEQRSKLLVHRVEIVHHNTTVIESFEEVFNTSEAIERSFILENNTVYDVHVTVCPTCPAPYQRSVKFITDEIVDGAGRNVSGLHIKANSSYECVIEWNMTKTRGVLGFLILEKENLNKVALKSVETQHLSTNLSRDVRLRLFSMKPNSKYTVTVRTITCTGPGPSVYATGSCIRDSAAPTFVSAPRWVLNNPNNVLHIPSQDERNGPISCVLVIMTYNVSSNVTDFGINDLNKIMKNSDSALQQGDSYLAVAIPRQAFAPETQINDSLEISLGDGTTTECNGKDISLSDGVERRKRDVRNDAIFIGSNRKLEGGMQYGVSIITITPGNSALYVKSSQAIFFTTLRSEETIDTRSFTSEIVGGILAALFIIIISAGIALLVVRRNRQLNRGKMLATAISVEEIQYVNVAFEEAKSVSETSIPLDELFQKYNELSADNNSRFQQEFERLKEQAKKLSVSVEIATSENVRKKNRYKNVIPADRSRVVLNSDDSDYINASYVEGFEKAKKFIATQGPLKSTVKDFWMMVMQQECTVIVMLTKCAERGKIKCERYWPSQGQTTSYGDINVECVSDKSYGAYIVRTLRALMKDRTLEVKQVHFLTWPDHGVPVTTTNIMELHEIVIGLKPNSPIVVHCSAGAGRTGAFIAYDILKTETKSSNSIDVYECVLNMRQNRYEMVQTAKQYALVHKLILEDHLFGKTSVSSTEFKNSLLRRDLEREFRNLSLVYPLDKEKVDVSRINPQDQRDVIPYLRNRVNILLTSSETKVPFINASFLECSDPKVRIIGAKSPVDSTEEVFWRCVLDHNVDTMVMLASDENLNQDEGVIYWPEETGQPLCISDITIGLKSTSTTGCLIHRVIHISREQTEREINHYQFIGWSKETCPVEPNDVLDLVQNVMALGGNGKTSMIVHCSDGVGRTGVFCTLFNLITRLKYDSTIDVFRTVKDLRDCRPDMVKTLEQYRFCYTAVAAHLDNITDFSIICNPAYSGQDENIYENC